MDTRNQTGPTVCNFHEHIHLHVQIHVYNIVRTRVCVRVDVPASH